MELKEVVSSNIRAIGHEGTTLTVEYIGGSKYVYEGVPNELFEDLIKAESKGKFINSMIKGKFEYKKMEQ